MKNISIGKALFIFFGIFAAFATIIAILSHDYKGTWNITKETPACRQEVKQCPDGSSVGRTEANCEFAKCPVIISETNAKQNPGVLFINKRSGWQRYYNEEYGFEIKVPPDFEVRRVSDEAYTGGMEFFIEGIANNKQGGIVLKTHGSIPRWSQGNLEKEKNITTKTENITFGEISAVKTTQLANSSPFHVFITNFSGINKPKWSKDASIDLIANTAIENKMLFSLRFIDPSLPASNQP